MQESYCVAPAYKYNRYRYYMAGWSATRKIDACG